MRNQTGRNVRKPALWLQLLAVFCMGLIAVASTVQVCHSHDDAFQSGLLKNASGADGAASSPDTALGKVRNSKEPDGRNPDSAVRCPLCIAMHSAMPVVDTLTQVAMVRLETMAPVADGIEREFRWRFEMASRPPPIAAARA